MDYIKEATLKQEKDHQKLLAAIRKAEEAELEESNISSSSDFETDSNVVNGNSDVSEDDEHPLSYYLKNYCFCSYCTVFEGWLKSKTINQYLSYDKTEPPLTISIQKKTIHLTT